MSEPKTLGAGINTCSTGRQTGRAVLEETIQRMHQKANELQTVVDMLPAKMSVEQDSALWNLACSLR